MATLAGVDFHFGIGGVHASVENRKFQSNADYVIIDLDVTSMYPSVAIANRFAPEHLGEVFETLTHNSSPIETVIKKVQR